MGAGGLSFHPVTLATLRNGNQPGMGENKIYYKLNMQFDTQMFIGVDL